MKKNPFYNRVLPYYDALKKLFLIMKLSCVLFFCGVLSVLASPSYAQTTLINLDIQDAPIETVLDEIENQSEFFFLYNRKIVDVKRKVNITVKNELISDVLDDIFDDDITYDISDRQIILSNKSANKTVATAVAKQSAIVITGTVVDDTGEALPGVNVTVKGTTLGVMTDFDGKYSISVPDKSVLLSFSFIGYASQEVTVGNQTIIDITLIEDTQMLDEIVVVGYGVQRKSAVAGAISSIKAEDMQNRATTSIVDAMAGKTAGVSIVTTSGAPGQSGSMLIRGYSSNQSSNPLYVVDGLRVSNINDLDPSTIESIEILKDAASAAIYGAEAGNGVIMVTTKKGTSSISKISYEGQFVINSLVRMSEILDAQEFVDWSILNGKYTQTEVDAMITAGLWDGKSSTDWMKEMTEQGFSQRHTISATGSTSDGNYFASIGYTNQDGIVVSKYDTFERINATLNVSYKLRPWLEIGNNTNFMHNSTNAVTDGSSLNGSFFGYIYYYDPTVSVTYAPDRLPTYMQGYLDAGEILLTDDNGDYYGVSQLIMSNPCNPWVKLKSTEKENKSLMLSGNAYLNITPQFIKNLTFTSRLGYNIRANNAWNFTRHYYGGSHDNTDMASVNRSQTNTNYWQWENFGNYNFTIADDHDFTLMLGMSYSENNTYYSYGSQGKLRTDIEENPLFWDLAYAASDSDDNLTGTHNWQHKLSYYGRFNYSYKDRYTVQMTMRADAADLSVLSAKNRWGYFPALSGAWTISNENWFPKSSSFNFLKLRGSWGQNGSVSSLSNYAYATTIATIATGYSFDGSSYTVSSTTSGLSNEDLKWETSEQLDFGIDARFLNDRLTFSGDWFLKTTKDLILSTGVTVPASAGAPAPVMNGGNVINRGLEFESGWRDKIGDFSYSVNANLSTLHNEVTKIQETVERYTANSLQSYGDLSAFEVGHPVWYLWTYHSLGIDSETGDPIIQDTNNDGQITVDDKIEAGSGLPDAQYGLTLNASYKNFDLSVFGQGVIGSQMFRATGPFGQNTMQYFYDRTWTEETKETATMAPMNSSGYGYYIMSDAFVFDSDYFKIKQIQLGYTLPSKITKKIGINNVRVYCSLEDWFIFTSYEVGMDPSTSANSSTGIGIDYGSYPNYKKTTFGINVSF